MPAPSTRRCFVALWPGDVLRADVAEFMTSVHIDQLRPTAIDNLHVTAKFLGDVEDSEMDEIIGGVEMACEGIQPFHLTAESIALMPDARRPRVLAMTTDRPIELMKLIEQLEDAMEIAGFRREGRRFNPHLTLGRFRNPPRSALPMLDCPDTGFRVAQLHLVESVLKPGGPEYTTMATFDLGR